MTVMSINNILPFVSTIIMFSFVVAVLYRYWRRRRPHLLVWGIGLAMFGAGSLAEAWLAVAWSSAMFFIWYVFGAALNAAWLGQGTVYLLVRRRGVAHGLMATLLAGSLVVGVLMLRQMPTLNTAIFTPERSVSEQYGSKVVGPGDKIPAGAVVVETTYRGETVQVRQGLLPLGAPVRLTTPFFNIYGLIALVGGAIYSAWLFWRKRVFPNRVIGNILIATGALLIGFASTLTRLGIGDYLYLGELLAAVLMFIGFLQATAHSPVTARQPEVATQQA